MAHHLALREWETATPESHPDLIDCHLRSPAAQAQARDHSQQGQVLIDDLAAGLRIQARSWVGRIALDDLTLSITPKLDGAPLLTLLRYAYRLHDLSLAGRAGYQTLVAEHALDALEQLSANPDLGLVVSDMHMPLMNGLELFETLRERDQGSPPFILLTGDAPETLLAQQPALDGCLMKDFSLQTALPRLVAELLAQPPAHSPAPPSTASGRTQS